MSEPKIGEWMIVEWMRRWHKITAISAGMIFTDCDGKGAWLNEPGLQLSANPPHDERCRRCAKGEAHASD